MGLFMDGDGIPLAFSLFPGNANGSGSQMGTQNMAEGMKQAGKTGLLHSTAAKIAVVTVVGILTVGTLYKMTHPENSEPVPLPTMAPVQTSSAGSTTEPSATEAPKEKEVADDEYSTLIEGNLTKEELEYVLAYGPERIPKNGFKKEDHIYIVNVLCQGGEQIPENYIKDLGIDSQYRHQYSLKDINRLYSSFTDYQFTEKNNNGANGGIEVKGKQIIFSPATLSSERTVHITAATYTPEEMDVYFDYEHMSYEEGTTTYQKKAILLPLPDGKYRIHSIQVMKDKSQTSSSSKSAKKTDTSSVKDVYKGVLESLQKGKEDYKVKTEYSQDTSDGPYTYFVEALRV